MRAEPNTSANRIATIPDGTTVQVISTSGEEIELAGKRGKWTEVQFQEKTGWVFGGFLSTQSASDSPAKVSDATGPYFLVSSDNSPLDSLAFHRGDVIAFLSEPCYDIECEETSNVISMAGRIKAGRIIFFSPDKSNRYFDCKVSLPNLACSDAESGDLYKMVLRPAAVEAIQEMPEYHDIEEISRELGRIQMN